MPWFDKALKSVQGTAEKAAFEADKLVRVRREEGALNEAQAKVQGKLAELGQAALALYRDGALTDPAVAGLAEEIVSLENQVKQQQDKLEAVRNEQYGVATGQAAPAPAAPVAAQPPATPPAAQPYTPPSAPPVAPPVEDFQAAPTAMTECPNCHTPVKATAAFCPECGTRLK